MPEYTMRIYWEMSKDVTISASTKKEAEEKAHYLELPEGEYVPDSFQIEFHEEE